MLESTFLKFFTTILNIQVNFFSNFVSFFIVTTHNTLVNLKLIYFPFWIKRPNKSPHLRLLCSSENLPNSSCHFLSHKSLFLQILHHSLASWNISPLYFLAQILYTLVKSSPLKCKFLRLSSAQVKICQIAYVNFKMTSQFLLRFFITLQCHYT